ncbi:MAG: geranylgeranyl reductase family protein [Chloroflexi bacterium]|nr:geranylgeranyl reductase family protein [Chloroflexota bacterium]
MEYDVIVVGAGPAGATAARECASRGLKVLLLDKARFPRDKPCGGGVNVRTARLMPFDLSPVVERTVRQVEFRALSGRSFVKSSDDPLCYMTQRHRLDAFLLNKATQAGAHLVERFQARSLERGRDRVAIKADGAGFRGRVLVIADGVNGTTATLAGIKVEHQIGAALEINLPLGTADRPRSAHRLVIFALRIKGGYGWLFPRADHINVGVCGWKTAGPQLRFTLREILHGLGRNETEGWGCQGYRLPVRRPDGPLVDGNAVLVGDAAGMVEPFSGDGIYGAVWSGKAAALAISEFFYGTEPDLNGYARAVAAELGASNAFSQQLHDLAQFSPDQFLLLVEKAPRVWRAIRRVMRGDESFIEIRRRHETWGLITDLVSDGIRVWPMLARRAGIPDPLPPVRFWKGRWAKRSSVATGGN